MTDLFRDIGDIVEARATGQSDSVPTPAAAPAATQSSSTATAVPSGGDGSEVVLAGAAGAGSAAAEDDGILDDYGDDDAGVSLEQSEPEAFVMNQVTSHGRRRGCAAPGTVHVERRGVGFTACRSGPCDVTCGACSWLVPLCNNEAGHGH